MRRPAILLLVAMAASLVLAGGVALAATVKCTAGSICYGTQDADKMRGSEGGEEMKGLGGNDALRGFGGFDFLRGGLGDDRLYGEADGDTYYFEGGWGADVVADDSGFDSLDFSFVRAPVVVDLAPKTSSPEARSGTNTVNLPLATVIEQAQGGFADDSLSGNDAGNAIEGDEGDDTIDGRGGADGIGGGRGDDEITGGPGRDIIYGRAGDDTIQAVDGEPDEINCGDGADTVYFDQGVDTLGSKCDNLNPPPQP